jgi:uncharacterized protein YbaR (Trm112 family)
MSGNKSEEQLELPKSLHLFEAPCPNCGESSFNIILKPSTTHRLICPKCKTTFYVHVKKDLGIVVLLKDEYKKSLCPDCKGTGKCSTCKGTGEMICPKCGGQGWFPLPRLTDYYSSCGHCGGDGRWLVGYDNFFGSVKRGQIQLGRGVVRCTECMGTGVCPRCGGEGLILGEE